MNKTVILQKLEAAQQQINDAISMMKSEVVVAPPETVSVSQPVVETPTRQPEKRALLIGVNKYDPAFDCDLSGCVQDALNIDNILVSKFDFQTQNIKLIFDYEATKSNIIKGLANLVDNAIPGDELVMSFSGHGSQVPDNNADEADGMDEIICPTDLNFDDPFTDDILASYFKKVPEGAQMTFICDSCHSGTVSRALSRINTFQQRKIRFLAPPQHLAAQLVGRTKIKRFGQKATVGIVDQRHILFAGCAEDNYSYEGYFNNKVQGAFTWNFCKMIRQDLNRTWAEAEKEVNQRLVNYGYTQIAQLVTRIENMNLKLFGG